MEKTVVLTPEERTRQEWEEFQHAADAAQAKLGPACPECGARAGYNPVTGIQVRSHEGRKVIEGHRDACSKNTTSKQPLRA